MPMRFPSILGTEKAFMYSVGPTGLETERLDQIRLFENDLDWLVSFGLRYESKRARNCCSWSTVRIVSSVGLLVTVPVNRLPFSSA